jgi:hypothetical protein
MDTLGGEHVEAVIILLLDAQSVTLSIVISSRV